MSEGVLVICFIAMAIFTATVLVGGMMFASGSLPHHDRPPKLDPQPRVPPEPVVPVAPPEDTGRGQGPL